MIMSRSFHRSRRAYSSDDDTGRRRRRRWAKLPKTAVKLNQDLPFASFFACCFFVFMPTLKDKFSIPYFKSMLLVCSEELHS